jgi:tetratricopeptide (TPR) repeat protein
MIRHIFTWLTALLIILSTILTNVLPVAAQTPQTIPAPTEAQLQAGDRLAQQAFDATKNGDFSGAESYWTQLIDLFPNNPATWSNRGNSRLSQNKVKEAIADFNKSIELAPDAPDPYLNRGIAWERLGKWNEAISDDNRVLELDPNDVMGYNNRGNAKAGLGEWEGAIADYQKASELAPKFAAARANYALALYQIGREDEALKTMRNLARKYPKFADMRAALTAVLWVQGQRGEAESNWVAAVGLDRRYEDISWVREIRQWPPNMVAALEKFLKLS